MGQPFFLAVDEIYAEAQKYTYVSFDIFDTLVKRTVASPAQVFALAEIKYNQGQGEKVADFSTLRVAAEKRARRKSQKKEINVDDIYKELPFKASVKEALLATEIAVEKMVCVPNRAVQGLYQRLLGEGKTIYLVSDMYLPAEVIEELLARCHIQGYKKLYLSSEYGCDKKSGLFRQLLSQERIQAADVLHIGDNLVRDYICPRLQGIHALRISGAKGGFTYSTKPGRRSLATDVVNCFIRLHDQEERDDAYRLGYAVFGPLLYAFSKWLEGDICQQGFNKILFIARDAYPLRRAFQAVCQGSWQGRDYYFCLSRLTILGELFDGNFAKERLLEEVADRVVLSLEKLLLRLNAYNKANRALAEGLSIDLKKDVFLANLGKKETAFLEQAIINKRPEYTEEAKIFEEYVAQYLEDGDKVAVVDIGWHGTAQQALAIAVKNLRLTCDLSGFYYGTDAVKYMAQGRFKTQGFVASEKSGAAQWLKIKATLGPFEFFASAPHGTTVSYKRESNRVLPVFKKESDEKLLSAEKAMNEAARSLQEGALAFVREFNSFELSKYITLNGDQAFAPLFRLCVYPSKPVLDWFGNLPYFETQYSCLARPKALGHYLCHPQAFKSDFANAGWKIGFMRRVMHNLPLPYYGIYTLLMKAFAK